jgi:hypothetical protein
MGKNNILDLEKLVGVRVSKKDSIPPNRKSSGYQEIVRELTEQEQKLLCLIVELRRIKTCFNHDAANSLHHLLATLVAKRLSHSYRLGGRLQIVEDFKIAKDYLKRHSDCKGCQLDFLLEYRKSCSC